MSPTHNPSLRITMNDTSAQVSEVYYRRLAEMTAAERVDIGLALWSAGDSAQKASIQRMYPGEDEGELLFRLAVVRFGEDLARRAYKPE